MPGKDSAPEAGRRRGGTLDPGRRDGPAFASIASGHVTTEGLRC